MFHGEHTTRKTTTFKPRLEALDDRLVPSATQLSGPLPAAVTADQSAMIQTISQAHASDYRVIDAMSADMVTRVYGQNVEFFATLKRSDTSVTLVGEPIKFYIDNTYVGTAKIGSWGSSALLQLPFSAVAQFHVGKHDIAAVFDGDAYFRPNSAHNSYIVYQSTASISGPFGSGKTNSTITMTATITDHYTGAPLAGKKIAVYIDNQLIQTLTTDASGRISYKYRIPQPNGHVVKYVFSGDTDYRATTGSSYISGV